MRGTVRGVKNRVRAGIATFLQDQTAKVSPPPDLCSPPEHCLVSYHGMVEKTGSLQLVW